jgi:hypothetical protein
MHKKNQNQKQRSPVPETASKLKGKFNAFKQ